MPEYIRIAFNTVHLRPAETANLTGQFLTIGTAGPGRLPMVTHTIDMDTTTVLTLCEDPTSDTDPQVVRIDVTDLTEVKVQFRVTDTGGENPAELGTIEHTLKAPYVPQDFRSSVKFYTLEWSVLTEAEGVAVRTTDDIKACRQTQSDTVNKTTVSTDAFEVFAEIHPVFPIPSVSKSDNDLVTGVRTKPRMKDAWVHERRKDIRFDPASPPNHFPNPAVIPILERGESVSENAARIEATFISPKKAAAKSDMFDWIASPADMVEFVGGPLGTAVMLRGLKPGIVVLTLRYDGKPVAKYRAAVRRVKKIPCRVNLFSVIKADGRATDIATRMTAGDVSRQMAAANVLLRQAGVRLVLDESYVPGSGQPVRDSGNTVVGRCSPVNGFPGYATIELYEGSAGWIKNVDDDGKVFPCGDVNNRSKVVNLCYIHSFKAKSTTIGLAAGNWQTSPGSKQTDLNSSVCHPLNGAPPAVTLGTFEGVEPDKFFFIMPNNGDPRSGDKMRTYANTLAHEICHVLGLQHRIGKVGSDKKPNNPDGLDYPRKENLMHWNEGPMVAQDLDVVQALALHDVCPLGYYGDASNLPPYASDNGRYRETQLQMKDAAKLFADVGADGSLRTLVTAIPEPVSNFRKPTGYDAALAHFQTLCGITPASPPVLDGPTQQWLGRMRDLASWADSVKIARRLKQPDPPPPHPLPPGLNAVAPTTTPPNTTPPNTTPPNTTAPTTTWVQGTGTGTGTGTSGVTIGTGRNTGGN